MQSAPITINVVSSNPIFTQDHYFTVTHPFLRGMLVFLRIDDSSRNWHFCFIVSKTLNYLAFQCFDF